MNNADKFATSVDGIDDGTPGIEFSRTTAVDCQRERHRLACAAWREREAPAVREYRLRRRLGCPEGSLKLDVVRDECGAKVKVVIEETLRLVLFSMRDECSSIVLDKRQQVLRLTPAMARDETAPARASP